MKTITFVLGCWFLILNIQSQDWLLSTSIPGSNIEPRYTIMDLQNNTYILSFFTDTVYSPYNAISFGSRDLFVTKINPQGNVLWNRQIGGKGMDIDGGITTDNNYIYVTGTFFSNCKFSPNDSLISSGTTGDIFLAKYDLNGNLQWAKKIGSSTRLETSSDIKYFNNKLVLCGAYRDTLIIGDLVADKDTFLTNGHTSNFISEFDLSGAHKWTKRILGTNNLSRIYRIALTDDSYFFGGYFQGDLIFDVKTISSYSAAFDAFLYKTDLQGNGQWVRIIRGQNAESIRSLATDEFNNIYFLGNYTSPEIYVDSTESLINTYSGNSEGSDTYIGKFNRSGIIQWFVRKGSSAKDNYLDFVVRNNVIYATGFFTDEIVFNNDTLRTTGVNNSDAFLAVFNQIGDPISGVSIFGTGDYEDAGKIVKMDLSSRAYISGYFRSPQIQIGDQIYTSNNINKSDLFFAIYQQAFKAVITDERMVSCHGLSDGMLTATPYFGRPPYAYSWSHNTSLNNPVADNLAAGTYTVTITDANDSTAVIAGVVSEPAALAIDSVITPVTCYNNGQDGAIDITVSGGTKADDYNYYWTTINGNGIVPVNQDQTGLSAGTYSVTVKDDNQCTLTEDFTVVQPAPFNFSASVVTDIVSPDISKGSIDLEVTGGNTPYASFAWTGPGGYTASSEDIGNLDQVGSYTVTLTDSKGCITDTTFGIMDNLSIFAEISSKTDVTCNGNDDGTATVTVYNGTPPYTYKWVKGPTTTEIPDATNVDMSPGTYYVTVTDGTLQQSLPVKVVISEPAVLSLSLTSQNLRCANDNSGVINLAVAGGKLPYTYAWSTGYNGEDLVNVAAGDYAITVTDKNGCIAQASKTITQPAGLWIDPVISGTILCHGDRSIDVLADVSGGLPYQVYPHYDFAWDDPGTQTTPTAYDLGAGTYHVTVTDSSQCSMTTAVIITEPDELSYTEVVTNPSCPGLSDGSIVISPVGGTGAGYEFVWDNNVFSRLNTDIPAGRYILTMNDANYCTLIDTFVLADPEPLEIVSVSITDVSCENLKSGSITIEVSGGSGIYDYSVDGGESFFATSTIGSLAVGNYEVIVRDNRGCISESIDTVLTLPEICGMVIYNAFSPNDDGINEVWNIGNSGSFPSIKVNIFNIWGKEVFSSKGYAEPWDGTYNGNDLPAGTYYYVIDPGDGSDVRSGDVSIVK